MVENVFCYICAYFQTNRIKFFKTIFFNVWSGKKRALMHLHLHLMHFRPPESSFWKRYFLTSDVVNNEFLRICAYFQTTRIKFLKKRYFLTSEVVKNVFWCICAYFQTTRNMGSKMMFLNVWCISDAFRGYFQTTRIKFLKKTFFTSGTPKTCLLHFRILSDHQKHGLKNDVI